MLNADDTSILLVTRGELLGANLFAYCGNNPVNMADDNGYLPFLLITGAIGALIGGIIGYATTGSLKGALTGAAIGGLIGLTGGAAAGYLLAGSATASIGAVILGGKLFIAGVGVAGYGSFEVFKRVFGNAGSGKAWHHIVQQTATNVNRFGAQAIHNARNIVRISHGASTLHSRLTGHYNSIQPFTNGMRVYEWLQTKTFEYQYNYGLQKLNEFAKQIGAIIEFVK
jgi:hypothetical protein